MHAVAYTNPDGAKYPFTVEVYDENGRLVTKRQYTINRYRNVRLASESGVSVSVYKLILEAHKNLLKEGEIFAELREERKRQTLKEAFHYACEQLGAGCERVFWHGKVVKSWLT